jgi:predicted transcriptional regulator
MPFDMRKVSELRMRRLSIGATQAEVAARAQCSQRAVSHCEAGNVGPQSKAMRAVLDALQRLQAERDRT